MTITPLSATSIAEIITAGVIYTIAAAIVQRKLSNPKKSRELQDKIKVISDELNKMIKANAPKEDISKKQGEMMPLMKQSMTLNMKATIVLIPSFLVVYYLIVPYLFGGLAGQTTSFSIGSSLITLQYKGVFFVVVFVLGISLSMSILAYDRYRARKDAKTIEAKGETV